MDSIAHSYQNIKSVFKLKCSLIYNQYLASNSQTSTDSDEKLHVTKLKHLIELIHKGMRFVGSSIIGEFVFNKMSYIVLFLLVIELVFLLYTTISVKEDLPTLLQCLVLFGLYMSCALKIYVGFFSNKTFASLFTFSVHVYKSNSTPNRIKILELQLEQNKGILLKLMYCYLCGSAIFIPCSAYSIFYLKELPFPLYIPYIDRTTSIGFFAVLGNSGFLVPLFVVGNLAYIAMYALMVLLFGDLVVLIEDSFKRLSVSKGKARYYFTLNTITQIKDGLRYTKFASEFFDNLILLQIGSSYVCCTITMFLLIAYKWYVGIAAGMFFMVEIYTLSYCGQSIYDSNKKLQNIIYSTDWYNFSVKEQKIILNLIHMVQNGTVLWIGIFSELRIEAGFNLTKNIYTYTMLMLDLLSH